MKPNCYKCKHRRSIPGDAHSQCEHPKVAGIDPLSVLLGILGKNHQVDLLDLYHSLNINGDAHGIKNGWFIWPYNFDPIWLLTCNGFEEK